MLTNHTQSSVVLQFALLADITMLSLFSGHFRAIQVVCAWVTVELIFVSSDWDAPALHLEVCLNTCNTNIVMWECIVFDRAPP